MKRFKSTRAFTLIELVVVIVILGILAAIAAFAYQSVMKNSKKSAMDKTAVQVLNSYRAALVSNNGDTALATADAVSDATVAGAVFTGTTVTRNGCTATVVLPTWANGSLSTVGSVNQNSITCL